MKNLNEFQVIILTIIGITFSLARHTLWLDKTPDGVDLVAVLGAVVIWGYIDTVNKAWAKDEEN